jgi:hypothetical protein
MPTSETKLVVFLRLNLIMLIGLAAFPKIESNYADAHYAARTLDGLDAKV